jgi:hypothetical protein
MEPAPCPLGRLSGGTAPRNKSSFLLFFKKEDSSFSEEKEAKRLLFLGADAGGPVVIWCI